MAKVGGFFLRLKTTRKIESPLEMLRSAVLFDPVWYRESQPDLRGKSIDAAKHYLDHGAREGRNPHPLFNTKWYLNHTPDASKSDMNPLVHYLLRKDFASSHPHPLFDVDMYISSAHGFESSQIDPLTHYLTIGWKQGIRPNKLFDPQWYLEHNPDVRATGIEPLSHYLQWGWRDDRRPNSTIDPIAYRERNGLTKDINPLLDFALYGEKRSTQKPTSNRDSSASRGRMTPSKTRDVSIVSPEPRQTAVAIGSVEGPGIRPPMPIAIVDDQQPARDIEIISAIHALRSKNRNKSRSSTQHILCEEEIKIISAKLELAGADDILPLDSIGAAVRESMYANGNGGHPALNALLGLGINPHYTVTADSLFYYGVPILNRYNQGRLEAASRFVLNPSFAGSIDRGPTISILVPVYKTPIIYLERAILSVLFQTCTNWELILVDDFSQRSDIEAMLKHYASVDPRIKVHFCKKNGGISAATNEALKIASGSYVGLLDHDDMLTRDALEKVADRLLNNDELDFIYTDECWIDPNNLVDGLFHKPDWSPLLLLNFMYTGHFSVYRKSLVKSVGGFRSKFDFSQDYDLALRIAERQPKVMHIEEILYGWRMIPGSGSVGDKPTARLSNIAALQDAADRRGYDGVAIALPTANRLRRAPPVERPLVSIVVPSAGKLTRIRAVVDSITSLSSYENYEIIFVTGSSAIESYGAQFKSRNIHFISYDKPFNFSDKCNIGASHAKGDFVIFFNDDVLVISPDWIESILECLTLPGVGAVSPKLLYENGAIQHAGIVTGVRRTVGTAFHSFPSQTTAYFNMAQSVRETSVVSGACLAMPMRIFKEIGGWETRNTPYAHTDIDLCFRIRERGYSCVYTPHAELTHIGHLEMGTDEGEAKKAKSYTKDKGAIFLFKHWGEYCARDPYFPPKMRDLVYIDSQEPYYYFPAPRKSGPTGPDVLIFSHDLTGSGAPRVVFDIARVLIEQGCFVVVISPEDGVFRHRLLEIGAHVIIDRLALTGHETITDLGKNFDLVIANTVVCWRVLNQLSPFVPIYWYVHETELVGHLANQHPELLDAFTHATAVWAGSAFSGDFLRRYGVEPAILEYGVEDPRDDLHFREKEANPNEIIISILATYEPRKGQDLAVLGFLAMPENQRSRCRLRLAGRTHDHQFRSDIEKFATEHSANGSIDFQGELDFASYQDQLNASDIILCSSRDDTLPLVSLNALAAGKILVCSQETGTSKYIQDGVSGFVLALNDPPTIAATLTKIVDNISDWPKITHEARNVFLNNFSRAHFKSRLLAELNLDLSVAANSKKTTSAKGPVS